MDLVFCNELIRSAVDRLLDFMLAAFGGRADARYATRTRERVRAYRRAHAFATPGRRRVAILPGDRFDLRDT